MKATGKKISNMEKELRLGDQGLALMPHILAIFIRGKRMGRDDFSGKMDLTMRVTL
jgi:hypothetical protein